MPLLFNVLLLLQFLPQTNAKMLDLDAPLMSARRLRCRTRMNQCSPTIPSDANRRVPFLWERSPGVPKYPPLPYSSDEEEFFTPKLPPGRLTPPVEEARVHYIDDEDDEDDANEVFLDALEKISLTESISGVGRSSSFIMERFLGAAQALAISSTYSTPKQPKRRVSSWSLEKLEVVKYVPHIGTRPQPPAKGCGLMFFFPWSLKHSVWDFKNRSPVSTDNDKDKMSTTACRASGWGAPFLNSSRLRLSSDICVKDEVNVIKSSIVCAKKPNEGDGVMVEREKTVLGLPQLRVPAESWLQQAADNRRRR